LIKIVKALQIREEKADTDYIFDVQDKADPANCLGIRLKKFFKGTQWEKIQTHDMRGSWATEAFNKNTTLHTVSKYLGHTNLGTTEKHYLKTDPLDVLKKAAAKMIK
jgi:integrase